MTFEEPRFSRAQVNKAGDQLVQLERAGIDGTNFGAWLAAMDKLFNWRASHAYPINTFQATLRAKLKKLGSQAFAAQRLKRTPSIIAKLNRPNRTRLARMQDIAGLRGVVAGIDDVSRLVDSYLGSRFSHELVRMDNYIAQPRESGYRGIHLVYRYENPAPSARPYQGLLVELQVRTRLQHIWATAVESTGTILKQALKASEGSEQWLHFFSLAASAFALMEVAPVLEAHKGLKPSQILKQLRHKVIELRVREQLAGYSIAAKNIQDSGDRGSFHLVVLDLENRSVRIRSFGRDRLGEANEGYAEVESKIASGSELQAVLVSTESMESLRAAYPNYFLDTASFIASLDEVEKVMGWYEGMEAQGLHPVNE